ncbi:MAG: alanine racemase [Gemmatimonadaceae bacterium]|nr:alanine racemase [Gemmatimonadaceae bacterium]
MTATPADARALSAMLTVDLAAVRENYRLLARRAAVPLLPMVKSDAYGLGAVEVARVLDPESPVAFGVASVDEGRALRAAGVARPVVVFTPVLPSAFALAREAGLTLALSDPGHLSAWLALGGRWQLPVDTGMNRAGVHWRDTATIRALLAAGPAPDGVFTHFHSADTDPGSMIVQEERFAAVVGALPVRPASIHAENSAALLQRGVSRYDCARPGIALYGVSVGPAAWTPLDVVRLAAPVVELRRLAPGDSVSYGATWRAREPRRIATVALGYADGYPRGAGNGATAVVNDRPVPVVGLVTMDMTMCDVTDVQCEVGDRVTLIGGDAASSVSAVAAHARRSPYEILTGLRARAARTYLASAAPVGVAA